MGTGACSSNIPPENLQNPLFVDRDPQETMDFPYPLENLFPTSLGLTWVRNTQLWMGHFFSPSDGTWPVGRPIVSSEKIPNITVKKNLPTVANILIVG